MTRIQWDEVVQAFATYRSDQLFAMRVGEGGQLHRMLIFPILRSKSSAVSTRHHLPNSSTLGVLWRLQL